MRRFLLGYSRQRFHRTQRVRYQQRRSLSTLNSLRNGGVSNRKNGLIVGSRALRMRLVNQSSAGLIHSMRFYRQRLSVYRRHLGWHTRRTAQLFSRRMCNTSAGEGNSVASAANGTGTTSNSAGAIASRAVKKPKKKRFRKMFYGMSLLSIGSGLAVYLLADPNGKHWQRSLYFWSRMFPVYMHYRYVDLSTKWLNYTSEERDAEFEKIHPLYSDHMYNVIIQLKGFYIKLGQIGASRPDILPKCWVDKLQLLEDACPTEDWSVIQDIICKEYDIGSIYDLFDFVDPKPLGSASIGQVHYAILKGTGDEVVIKVQYPDVESLFRSDFKVARSFCELAQPAHLNFLDETEKQFKTEFDYRLEAENLAEICSNINDNPLFSDTIVVPKPYMDLCHHKCLVMEFLRGTKLIKALTHNIGEVASHRGMTMEEFMEEQRKIKPPPTARQMQIYRYQVMCLDFLWNSLAFLTNWTFGLVFFVLGNRNKNIVVDYRHTPVPLNIKRILDLVIDVHGYELIINGAFNGDCHPGNIILCNNECKHSGKIGLIDYGQVKRLTLQKRINLAKLLVYLARDDRENTVREMKKTGFETRDMNEWVVWQHSQFFIDRDDTEFTQGMNAQMYLEHLESIDPIKKIDDDLVMASRMKILLSGLGHALGYDFRFSKLWLKWSMQLLNENGVTI